MSNELIFIRQPIFDTNLDIFAYELQLHQSDNQSLLLDSAAFSIDPQQLSHGKPLLLPLTKEQIECGIAEVFKPEQIIIDLSMIETFDETFDNHIKKLKKSGYQFSYQCPDIENNQDKNNFNIIKIDVNHVLQDNFPNQRQQWPEQEIMAVNIDDYQKIETCKNAGVNFFKGTFVSKPNIIKAKKIEGNRLVLLKLLSELQSPDIEMEQLEKLISSDVALSYKILRVINSAAYSFSREIESIKEASVMLGIAQIKRLASSLIMSQVSDKPSALMEIALTRAKMCELIGEKKQFNQLDSCFTVGLFSTLDALFDQPIAELIKELPLSNDIKTAIVDKQGSLGEILTTTIQYEQGQWGKLNSGIPFADLQQIYLDCLAWVQAMLD